jgi:hypothetical protein
MGVMSRTTEDGGRRLLQRLVRPHARRFAYRADSSVGGYRVVGDGEDDRPWEAPGAVRRDCEPHRGAALYALGLVALVLGFLSGCLLVTAPVALALGVVVRVLARRDMRSIQAGLTDPAGEPALRRASVLSAGAVLASAPALVVMGMIAADRAWLVTIGDDKQLAAWACHFLWAVSLFIITLIVSGSKARGRQTETALGTKTGRKTR